MAASILDWCIKTLGPASKVKLFNIILKFLGHSIYKLEFLHSKNVRSVFFEFHLSRP